MHRSPRRRRPSRLVSYVVGCISLALICTGVIGLVKLHQRREGQRAYLAKVETLHRTLQRHMVPRWDNDRWLEINLDPTDEASTVETNRQFSDIETRLRRLIEENRSVAPLADSIGRSFPRLHASVFFHGISRALSMNRPIQDIEKDWSDGLEVCFIPRSEADNAPNLLYYRQDWRALMLGLLNWPDEVLAPLLLHELGHAYSHIVLNSPSATAPDGSELYDREETEMHDLEMLVQNRMTNGRYFALVDAIIDRTPTAKNELDSIFGLTNDDLRKLDAMFRCSNSGHRTVSALHAQFIYTIGARYLDRRVQGSRPRKVELYRWLRKTI